jgi:N,N'-diacetyllegionaminate synthase
MRQVRTAGRKGKSPMSSIITNTPVHIIAEAGTNHNGKPENARQLVDFAATAKADTVKFQIINPDYLYLPGVYVFGKYDINKVRDMRKRFMLSNEEFRKLADYAASKNVSFTASVFDEHGLNFYCSLKPQYIKIASTDLSNVRFLRKVAEKGIRIILSTGMSSLGDIEYSVNEILKTGFKDLILMHCVSSYPAKLSEMNLGFLDVLRSAFGFPVGLSDHTQSSIAACMALSKGVSYLEKHFTADKTQEGFDHEYAAEPNELAKWVEDIRAAETALCVPSKKIGDSERLVRNRARRSLYAARNMKTGETIKDADVLVLRPENIMQANKIDELIGRTLLKDINQYSPFSPDLFR